MDNYKKFKCLLEYFISHLEWANGNKQHVGYKTYIDALIKSNSFKKSGQGWKGHDIQCQIKNWEDYNNNTICINITPTNYKSTSCYLNWEGTWLNIRPRWTNNHISCLFLSKEEKANAEAIFEKSLSDLGLFDNNKPNDTIKEFYDEFYKMIDMHNKLNSLEKFISLLTANHNLILTGAPGTGKTYLAKQIAQQMIFGEIKENLNPEEENKFNEQCGFVQFHPSYDYTDFVEGLRPMQDEAGNVGFERKDGVFKTFCKNAVRSTFVGGCDNFDEVWDKLIAHLEDNPYIEIPLLTGARNIRIELNSYGTGLTERLYSSDGSIGMAEKIRGHSKFFTKEQLYNIYRGLKGVPSGGHDNYRKAIVGYLKKKIGLKDYSAGQENKNVEKYVFIIDEINRGEISKIFGELFFSIDPGYRGEKGRMQTQYQNIVEDGDIFKKGFYVPENVYIIGTMNDIDRSVESMDFAFRRRFAFKEIKADDRVEMLDELPQNGIAINRMKNLNKAIESIEGLSTAYHIGPAYFLKLKNYNGNFQQLWENHLEGLLREYLRGMQKLEEKLKTLKAAYDNESDSDNGQQQE